MFKDSFKKLRSTKYLCILALFIALKIVVAYFKIPVGDNLNIYFTFVITAIECTIFGYGPSLLPIEIIILYLVFKMMIPILQKRNLI